MHAPWNSSHSANSEEIGPGGRSAQRTVAALVVVALLAAGVWLLIGEAANYSKLTAAIDRAGPLWLVIAGVSAMLGYLGYALLYQGVARVQDGPRPSLPLTVRLTVAVFGASVIATAAGRLGSEYWSLRQMRERPHEAWSRVLAINTAAWALLAALAFLGTLALFAGGGRAPLAIKLPWLLALPVCAVPAMWLSSPARRSLSENRGGFVRRPLSAALRGLVLLRSLRTEPDAWSRALLGGLLYWASELLTVWAALRAFGVDLGLAPLVVGYATGYASTMLPLPAGGAGGVDAASTYALTLVGVPLGPALLATVVQRLYTYWLPLAVTIFAARSLKQLGHQLRRVPRPTAVRISGAAVPATDLEFAR